MVRQPVQGIAGKDALTPLSIIQRQARQRFGGMAWATQKAQREGVIDQSSQSNTVS